MLSKIKEFFVRLKMASKLVKLAMQSPEKFEKDVIRRYEDHLKDKKLGSVLGVLKTTGDEYTALDGAAMLHLRQILAPPEISFFNLMTGKCWEQHLTETKGWVAVAQEGGYVLISPKHRQYKDLTKQADVVDLKKA